MAAGKYVFHRGDSSYGIYCVMSGAVCFGAIGPSGKASIVGLAEAPQRNRQGGRIVLGSKMHIDGEPAEL